MCVVLARTWRRCRYRCTDGINLPFKVMPTITEHGRTRLEFNVTLKALFSAKLSANNVVVLLPVPDHTAKANILVTNGRAKYDPGKKSLVWKMRKFGGACVRVCAFFGWWQL